MYSGIEVDMLSLGNADSILVSFWNGFPFTACSLTAANKGDAATVSSFLRNLKIKRIDDLLSTHHHDDHSGGLLGLLSDQTRSSGRSVAHSALARGQHGQGASRRESRWDVRRGGKHSEVEDQGAHLWRTRLQQRVESSLFLGRHD
jgi:beta-lactamase superfamily II metal-dependent hydrolase